MVGFSYHVSLEFMNLKSATSGIYEQPLESLIKRFFILLR